MSPQRQECIRFLENWFYLLQKNKSEYEIKDVLDVGIAGDEPPSGNFKYWKGVNFKTLDVDPQYKPDIVADITLPSQVQKFRGQFDLIIISNVIEHVFRKEAAIRNAYDMLRPGGYLIIDCPWVYPYHAEDNFDDYWRISATAMQKLLEYTGFRGVESRQGELTTSAIGRTQCKA